MKLVPTWSCRAMPIMDEETEFVLYSDHLAAIEQARNETAMLRDVLMRSGFVPCDIPACNCGSFHHRYGLPERMNELRDALVDAEVLDNSTGNLPLNALKKLRTQRDEAQAWKRAVDDLLATWYTTADSYETPREAVKALIAFEVMTALDPAVSGDIADIVARTRREEREACIGACNWALNCVAPKEAVIAKEACIAAIRARKP